MSAPTQNNSNISQNKLCEMFLVVGLKQNQNDTDMMMMVVDQRKDDDHISNQSNDTNNDNIVDTPIDKIPEEFDIELNDLNVELNATVIDRYPPSASTIAASSSNGSVQNNPSIQTICESSSSRISTNGIPMFCFPNGLRIEKEMKLPTYFMFVTTDGCAQKMYGYCLTFPEEYKVKVENNIERVFIPKSIVLLSKYGIFYSQFKTILLEIYRSSITISEPTKEYLGSHGNNINNINNNENENNDENINTNITSDVVPVERIICNIVSDAPLPPRGRKSVTCKIADKDILFSRPPLNLPIASTDNIAFRAVFECLSLQNIVTLFAAVLQERQIVVISSQYSLLSYFGEVMRALLFPFDWQHVYIPILPTKLLNFLQAPFPFIMGVHQDILKSDNWEEISTSLPESLIRVNMDNCEVKIPKLYPVEEIPTNAKAKLLSRLSKVAPAFNQRESDWKETTLPYYDIAISQTIKPSETNELDSDDQDFMRDDGIVDCHIQAQIKNALLDDFLSGYDIDSSSISVRPSNGLFFNQKNQSNIRYCRAKCHWGLVRVAFLRFLISACANFRDFIMKPVQEHSLSISALSSSSSSSSTTTSSTNNNNNNNNNNGSSNNSTNISVNQRNISGNVIVIQSSIAANKINSNELIFSDTAFISSKPKNEQTFYGMLIRSQHFRIFIDEILHPSHDKPNPDIEFFEECIDARSNRLIQTRIFGGRLETPFISNPEYLHTHIAIVAHRPESVKDAKLIKIIIDRERKSMRFFPRLDPSLYSLPKPTTMSLDQPIELSLHRISQRSAGSGVQAVKYISSRKDGEQIRNKHDGNGNNNHNNNNSNNNNNNNNNNNAWLLSTVPSSLSKSRNGNRDSGHFYDSENDYDNQSKYHDHHTNESILMRATRLLINRASYAFNGNGSFSNQKSSPYLSSSPEQAIYATWFILYSLNIGRYSAHHEQKSYISKRISERIEPNAINKQLFQDQQYQKYYGDTIMMKGKFTYDDIIRELSGEQLSIAFTVLERAKTWNPPIEIDEVVYRSLIAACGRCGDVDRAIQVLGYMKDARIRPDAIVYSNLIHAFSMNGNSNKASSATVEMLSMLRWDDLPKEVEQASNRLNQRKRSAIGRRLSSRLVSERFQISKDTPSPMFQKKIRNWGSRLNKKSSTSNLSSGIGSLSNDGSGVIKQTPSYSASANNLLRQSSKNIQSMHSISSDKDNHSWNTPSKRSMGSTLHDNTVATTPLDKIKAFFTKPSSAYPASSVSTKMNENDMNYPNTEDIQLLGKNNDGNSNSNNNIISTNDIQQNQYNDTKTIQRQLSISNIDIPDTVLKVFPKLVINTEIEVCPNKECNKAVHDHDIREGWSQDPNDYTTQCPYCGHRFLAFFTVKSSDEKWKGTSGAGKELYCEFISPWVLYKELHSYLIYNSTESIFAVDFRLTHTYLFWNLVLYWIEFNLPIEFFICNNSILDDIANDDSDPESDTADNLSEDTAHDSPQTLCSDSGTSYQDRISIRTNDSVLLHEFDKVIQSTRRNLTTDLEQISEVITSINDVDLNDQ